MEETNLPEFIENKSSECLIYKVREMYVMLDSDVASYFNVETKYLNICMKRNINRFSSDIVKVDKKKIWSTFVFC